MADATIILAGGTGTRLWPASLRESPKQLFRVGGGQSLIQRAILLALAATPTGPIVIVTNRDHVGAIEEHVAELDERTSGLAKRIVYLPEPMGRNTAPAIALGIVYLKSISPADAQVLVLTADHLIGPPDRFASDSDDACHLAMSGNLVCFGITPDRPETGYGYIHAGDPFGAGFRVDAFVEKPDLPTAEAYLSAGGYYWNAGMFCFTISGFLTEMGEHSPELISTFLELPDEVVISKTPAGSHAADPNSLTSLYSHLPNISIDYALMERSEYVVVVPASFSWSDIGSWDEVARVADGKIAGALHDGPHPGTRADRPAIIEVDSSGNHVDSALPVAICGVSDIHVVIRNGKVLVCRRGSSQLVKHVVTSALSDNLPEFL